jgi:hypothetical protein
MSSINELETKIDSMIIAAFSAISDLEKILKNPKDSNEIKILKALCKIDNLKAYEKRSIINNIIYAEKNNDIIDNSKFIMLSKIMETLKIDHFNFVELHSIISEGLTS